MSVSIVSLASGSKGNSTLVFSDDTAILVDAGVSYTRLNEELRKFGLNTAKLDGVVITHEHTDHIAALPRLGRDTRIFAHPKTAQAIVARQGELSGYTEVDFYEGGFTIGDIEVIPFRIPHDAAYPLGYSFRVKSGAQVSVATDMGRRGAHRGEPRRRYAARRLLSRGVEAQDTRRYGASQQRYDGAVRRKVGGLCGQDHAARTFKRKQQSSGACIGRRRGQTAV